MVDAHACCALDVLQKVGYKRRPASETRIVQALLILLGAIVSLLLTGFVEWMKKPSLSLEIEAPPLPE